MGVLDKKKVVATFVALFIWLCSGSVFQTVYESVFQKIIVIAFFFLVVYEYKVKGPMVRRDVCSLFMAALIVSSCADIIIWNEPSQILLYIANIGVFYLCIKITERYEYRQFVDVFLNIMMIGGIISLIGWKLTPQIINSGFGLSLGKYMHYRTLGVFNIIESAPKRNTGFFWEPGMYQEFLNLGILLIIQKEKKKISDILKIAVFAICVLTTYSTTGYIVLCCLAALAIYKAAYTNFKSVANVFAIAFLVLFFAFGGVQIILDAAMLFFPKEVVLKPQIQDVSYTTRIYSVITDLRLSLSNPFGISRTQSSTIIGEYAKSMGYNIDARTSALSTAFVYHGIFAGILYCVAWIKGIFLVTRKDVIMFLFTLIIMFLMLNSEPMYYHMIFSCIMIYWARQNKLRCQAGEEKK